MTDLLLRIGLSNLILSTAIALLAFAVQWNGKHPRVAHFLWLIVLVKLVTPPVVSLPVVEIAPPEATTALSPAGHASPTIVGFGRVELALLWLAGSAVILAWSTVRIVRFHRLLGSAADPASPAVSRVATRIASRLGIRRPPHVLVTAAHVSPMVWWVGAGVHVIVPAGLERELGPDELCWVLAHELAHVRRRDHLVRWLEWLSVVLFWWNPVAWLARRNLRANEELCCDALVLECLAPNPRAYGNSLLRAVEFLAAPLHRPPAMASEVNSGGLLERRFERIVSARPRRGTPRRLSAGLLLFAVAVLPLGLARTSHPAGEATAKTLRAAAPAARDPAPERTDMPERASPPRAGFRARMAAVKEEIRAAVKDGRLSEEDADRRWQGYLEDVRRH